MTTFDQIETCARAATLTDAASRDELLQATRSDEWRVRYAACVALGDRADKGERDAATVPAIIEVLRREDAAPLYAQPQGYTFAHAGSPFAKSNLPPEADDATREAWRRRGRVKQAACWALGALLENSSVGEAGEFLHRYANSTDAQEDHQVRAAANRALGRIGDGASRPFLERATRDAEWCSACEARKALERIG